MKTFIKKQLMRTFALIVIFAMLCSITRLPAAVAYFTGETKQSETIALVISKDPDYAGALVEFLDKFIVEADDAPQVQAKTTETLTPSFSLDGDTMTIKSLSLDEDTSETSTMTLSEPDEPESTVESLEEQETLKALINLEEGFSAGDLYIPSIQLHFNDNSAIALSGELNESGDMLAYFDRAEVASWFKGSTDGIEQVAFDVTGEGYLEGLYLFYFEGTGTIKLAGSYETRSVEILGSTGYLIPDGDELAGSIYELVNQDGVKLEDVNWGLMDPYPGVEIDSVTGELTILDSAAEGSATVTADVEREGRVHKAWKTVAICHDPGLEIVGAGLIAFYPGTAAVEQYVTSTQTGVAVDSITWELAEEFDGVTVDHDGTVTVDGTASEGSFTLIARAQLQGIPLAAEVTVLIEHNIISGTMLQPDEEEPVPDTLQIAGENFILIPAAGATKSFTYIATDLEGNPLKGAAWTLLGEAEGVELDGNTLTVSDTAGEGSLTLQAIIEPDSMQESLSGKKQITLAYPVPTAVVIIGATTITIPAEEEGQTQSIYTVGVLDQKGDPMDSGPLTWELAEQYEGIFLNETGELTVTSNALAGTVTLIARYAVSEEDELVGTLDIDVTGGTSGGGGGGAPGIVPDDVVRDDEDEEPGLDDGGDGGTEPGGENEDENNGGEPADPGEDTGGENDITEPGNDDDVNGEENGDDETVIDDNPEGDDQTGGDDDAIREEEPGGVEETPGDDETPDDGDNATDDNETNVDDNAGGDTVGGVDEATGDNDGEVEPAGQDDSGTGEDSGADNTTGDTSINADNSGDTVTSEPDGEPATTN